MKIRIMCATLATATILTAGSTALISPAARAASWSSHTYANKTAGYTVKYPSGWQIAKVTGLDLFVGSPDNVAFISANATETKMTADQIHLAQQRAFLHFGTVQGKPSYVTGKLNGILFQIGEVVVKTPGKSYADILVADAAHGKYVYDFNAGVKLTQKGSDAASKLVQNSLESISIQ
jgi:hypothetical protein